MLITILSSMLIVRAAAIALVMTGMNYERAKFQALSAFSGTGFTTREAERVVNHPRRRRIVSGLMILGNAGIVTVIVTGSASFARAEGLQIGLNIIVLVVGIGLLVLLARRSGLAKRWESFVRNRLSRLAVLDDDATVDELLHIAEGFGVIRIRVSENSPLHGKTFKAINDDLEHASVLGLERDHIWMPTSMRDTTLLPGDDVVVYGKLSDLTRQFG
jgi:hypothetical protein